MEKLRDGQISLNKNDYKSFLVESGCHIVRKRCLRFIEALKALNIEREIPLEEAKELFSKIIGPSDRKTLKAYFGTQASQSIKRIQKIARYSTGTFSVKNIELAQEVQQQKGYFEILGLAKIEQRGHRYFFVLTNEVLVPQLFRRQNEGLSSMGNFSLPLMPHSLIGKPNNTVLEKFTEKSSIEEKENKQTNYRVGERNLVEGGFLPLNGEKHTSYASICLTPEEEAILKAKPLDSEPDRAKIKWGDNHE